MTDSKTRLNYLLEELRRRRKKLAVYEFCNAFFSDCIKSSSDAILKHQYADELIETILVAADVEEEIIIDVDGTVYLRSMYNFVLKPIRIRVFKKEVRVYFCAKAKVLKPIRIKEFKKILAMR